ncbi:MAG: hypothetical protein DWP97_03470 [Calditrichaeota bacterium]|nr:MAG: hypothetical protein DWP97_03470 [Calditrichota bacterium]
MFKLDKVNTQELTEHLASSGFWAATASKCFGEKKYSKAVELCRQHLDDDVFPLSARLIYAKSLFYAGQIESSEKEFYKILSIDSDNLVALKYIGDIKFSSGDQFSAFNCYQKIQMLDPMTEYLASSLTEKKEITTTITLKRSSESKPVISPKRINRKILFYTETIGDLYLAQGFPQLAEEVFTELQKKKDTPRLAGKLTKAREKIKEKDAPYVKKTD